MEAKQEYVKAITLSKLLDSFLFVADVHYIQVQIGTLHCSDQTVFCN